MVAFFTDSVHSSPCGIKPVILWTSWKSMPWSTPTACKRYSVLWASIMETVASLSRQLNQKNHYLLHIRRCCESFRESNDAWNQKLRRYHNNHTNGCPSKHFRYPVLFLIHPFSFQEWVCDPHSTENVILLAELVEIIACCHLNFFQYNSGVESISNRCSVVAFYLRVHSLIPYDTHIVKGIWRPIEWAHPSKENKRTRKEIVTAVGGYLCANMRRSFPCSHQAEFVRVVVD